MRKGRKEMRKGRKEMKLEEIGVIENNFRSRVKKDLNTKRCLISILWM